MSQTRAQRLKQKKAKNRQNRIKRFHHIQQNAPDKKYRLDILVNGQWQIGVRAWAYEYQVENHKQETERLRKAGDEVVAGRIVDMKSGKVISEIPASKPKGAMPDKIVDGPKVENPKGSKTEDKDPMPVESPAEGVKEPVGVLSPEQEVAKMTGNLGENEGEKKSGPVSKFIRILTGNR